MNIRRSISVVLVSITIVFSMLIVFLIIGGLVLEKHSLANVRSFQGYEVYFLCDPVLRYEVVGQVSIMKESENPHENAKKLVSTGESEFSEIKWDAIITSTGKSATLIKYKRTFFP